MRCFRCNRKPDQIEEYVEMAQEEGMEPEEYVRKKEGSFNREAGTFACTSCYIDIGMPSSPRGWRAPDPWPAERQVTKDYED